MSSSCKRTHFIQLRSKGLQHAAHKSMCVMRGWVAPKSPWTNSFTYVPADVSMSRMNMRLETNSEDMEWITFSRTSPVRR